MEEELAREIRSRTAELLRKHGLSWIVDQAEERIRLGKTTPKQVSAPEGSIFETLTGTLRRTRKRRTEFLASEPFSEVESLDILLEAIESGLVDLSQIQTEAFKKFGESVTRVEFVSVRDGEPSSSITREDLLAPHIIAAKVREIIAGLRHLP